MQLMRLAEVPLNPRDQVFRYSRFRAVFGAMILVAVASAAAVFGWLKGVWLAYYVAAVSAVCLLLFQKLVTARFRQSNWLVRMTDHGLFVKFRSYLNHHFAEEHATVVFLPYSEIRSARLLKERQELSDRDERNRPATTTRTRRLLELDLAGDSAPFAAALAQERERVFARTNRSAGKSSSRYQHFPVQLISPTLLRIEWSVVPGAQTMLDALTRHTLVQPAREASKNYVNLEALDREDQETRLLELAESGDMIGAIAMARKLYSYDLTRAKQFVEELMHKQPARR
jgi:hypothetical protein